MLDVEGEKPPGAFHWTVVIPKLVSVTVLTSSGQTDTLGYTTKRRWIKEVAFQNRGGREEQDTQPGHGLRRFRRV